MKRIVIGMTGATGAPLAIRVIQFLHRITAQSNATEALRRSRDELQAAIDGGYRWFLFEAEPLRDNSGNIVKWCRSATDIEERKLAELSLRETEQRFRDYAETASDWLWETGPDHRIITISENINVAGLPRFRLQGVTRWEVASDLQTEPEKWRRHRQALDAHRPFRNFVYGIINESGSQIHIRTSGKPVFDFEGRFLGYRGTATDITASMRADQAEQALRKAQAELAHVTRVTTLGEMTASIAHEVNQPLAGVVANAAACLRWLARETPDLDAVRLALSTRRVTSSPIAMAPARSTKWSTKIPLRSTARTCAFPIQP